MGKGIRLPPVGTLTKAMPVFAPIPLKDLVPWQRPCMHYLSHNYFNTNCFFLFICWTVFARVFSFFFKLRLQSLNHRHGLPMRKCWNWVHFLFSLSDGNHRKMFLSSAAVYHSACSYPERLPHFTLIYSAGRETQSTQNINVTQNTSPSLDLYSTSSSLCIVYLWWSMLWSLFTRNLLIKWSG